ncbi:YihY/virulence factor BrkB family protein [Bacillus niameyensis]|uniref:YihY/virulence factor BrkB family protein n=1 Tax=Bacillus niameyensis TaxID=1522308 RepID=UPI00078591D1|nr:YihY/virulence factor BrkB family protein [Bacillus niameyensis]
MSTIVTLINRFFTERFHDQSALIAYYFMLAFFPFLIFAISITSFFPIHPKDILNAIEPFIPKASFNLIEDNIMSMIGKKQTRLASLSLLAGFWIASMAVQAFVRSMNDVYKVVRKEGFFLALGKDLLMTAGLMTTLTISLLVPIGEEIARVFLVSHFELPNPFYRAWVIFKWGTGSLYLFFFFLLLYKIIPSKKVSFLNALPGAMFSTIGWQIVSFGFSYYVTYFASYSMLYGYVANIIVLMIWFYFSAAVLLIGGLVNVSWIERKAEGGV